MSDLRTLLELTAEGMDGPDLVRPALESARRRRTRRRGALAGVTAGAAVLAAVVVPQVVDGVSDRAAPSREVTPTPTATPTPDRTPVPADPDLPPIPDGVRDPAFDPATAAELPSYPIASLPTVVTPTRGMRSTPGDREGPLAFTRSPNDRTQVLYGDRGPLGQKRVDRAGDLWDSALSRDGTRAAVVGEGGLFWCDATEAALCSSWTEVAVPDDVLDSDARLTWTQESRRLVVAGVRTAYLVDLDSGELTERPELGGVAFDVAPDGEVVTLEGYGSIAVFEDGIVATRVSADGDGGLVLLSRDGRTVEGFLPVEGDVAGMVERGELEPLQWLNKVTVLFSVLDPATRTVHLVTWDLLSVEEYGESNHGHVASYPAGWDVGLRSLYPA